MGDPPKLSRVFLVHAGGEAADPGEGHEDLERGLWEAYDRGRAAWPGLLLAAPVFTRHLAERLSAKPGPASGLHAVHAGDLYLACACLHGVPGALAAFEESHLVHLPAFLTGLGPDREMVGEVGQAVRERLFTGGRQPAADGGAEERTAPRIGEYTGRGPLRSWLRVVVARTAQNLRRQGSRRRGRTDAWVAERAVAAAQDPELDFIKARYRPYFEEAIRSALGAISPEQRRVLRLHFVAGATLDQMAALLRVHRATVARRLADARRGVLQQARRFLEERLRVGPEELDSLLRLVRSQIDISLGPLLAEGEE